MRNLAVLAGLALAPGLAAAAPASAACKPAHAHTIARHGGSGLYSVARGQSDEYGTATTLYGCRSNRRKPKRLAHFETTVDAQYANVRFAGAYAAFSLVTTDIACTKYQPENPDCTARRLVSFNLSTGRRRVAVDTAATEPVVVARGWIAWIEPGTNAVRAFDSGGARTLDDGPASALRATGNTVSWEHGTEARSAALR